MASLKDIIKDIARDGFTEPYGVICTVKEVNGTTCTCSPISGEADFIGVRLQAQEGNGIKIVPAIGSKVIVQAINEATGYVAMFSDIESIQFLDGSMGGMVKVNGLLDRLNNIETKINSIIQYLSTATAGGSPLAPPYSGGNIDSTVLNDLENKKVKHGEV